MISGARDDPAQPRARGEDLGEGLEADDVAAALALLVQLVDRGQALAEEAYLAVRRVLDDEEAVLVREVEELAPLRDAPADARRVLEVGYHVDVLDLLPGRDARSHNAFAARPCRSRRRPAEGDAEDLGPVGLDGLDLAEVGRACPAMTTSPGSRKTLQAMSRACWLAETMSMLLAVDLDALPRLEGDELVLELVVALGRAVLEGLGGASAEDPLGRSRADPRRGRSAGSGRPPAKEMMSGCCVSLRSSRMIDFFILLAFFE